MVHNKFVLLNYFDGLFGVLLKFASEPQALLPFLPQYGSVYVCIYYIYETRY